MQTFYFYYYHTHFHIINSSSSLFNYWAFVLVSTQTNTTNKGIKKVRSVVLDCMKNIHPVYNIKRLMIVRELEKDPRLKDENWDRFLPTFKKTNVPRKKPRQSIVEGQRRRTQHQQEGEFHSNNTTMTTTTAATSTTLSASDKPAITRQKPKKKSYTPFPPAQLPSKIDRQLDSGEYFLSERERKDKKLAMKKSASLEKTEEKRRAREQEFVYHPAVSVAGSGDNVADVDGDRWKKRDNGRDPSAADVGGGKKRSRALASETDSTTKEDVERLVTKFAKRRSK